MSKTRTKIIQKNRLIKFKEFIQFNQNAKAIMNFLKMTKPGYHEEIRWDNIVR
jgi:hypothetical protein